MATPEGRVKDKVKKALRDIHAYWFMPVQNGMGSPSLDFLICYNGRFFGIETKAPGKTKPTPRQANTMRAIENAGGGTFLVHDEQSLEYAITEMQECEWGY